MRKLATLAATCLLWGCATTPAALGEQPPDLVLESSRPARDVASCLAIALGGQFPVNEVSAGHYLIVVPNGYNTPIARWDLVDTPAGSTLELRSARLSLGEGKERARQCAEGA